MQSLPLFHNLARQPVILLGAGDAADARRRLIERAGGVVVGEADGTARLAFIAIDEPAEAEAAAGRLKVRGLLVNVTDRPALCDFTVPSLVDRDPVLIAVGTGGASAGLAKAVRLRLDALLPTGLGALALALQKARQRMRERWPDAAVRRHALDAALAEGGALDPLASGDVRAVERWLTGPDAACVGRSVEIRLTSDDPDDLTLRSARLLGAADVIAHDAGVPAAILARARADAVRIVGPAPVADTARLVVILRNSQRAER